jgi:hypothetical protein
MPGSRKGRYNKSTYEIKDILDKVVDWNVIASKLYSLATGEKPDAFAIKTLIEFRYGKAAQSMKIEGGDKPLQHNVKVTIVRPT